MFEPENARFRLVHMHPGHTLAEIQAATGFRFEIDPQLSVTPAPDEATLALLRGRVLDELGETYPDFAQQLTKEITAHAE